MEGGRAGDIINAGNNSNFENERNKSNGFQWGNGHIRYKVKTKLRALVVDSARTCNMIETAILRSHGMDSFGVEHGLDALNLFASGAAFHLMVIDQHLPFMTGAELIKRIREMGIRSKIIGLTASPDVEEDCQEMIDAGADGFSEKPLDIVNVLEPILMELDQF